MSNYTHYTVISVNSAGQITKESQKRELHARGIPGVPGAVAEVRVLAVRDDTVAGWGSARAIGKAQRYIDGEPEGDPFVCFLH